MLLAFLALASLQAQAQELFSSMSVNPSQAQFRKVRKVGDVVCGEVNKPNTQGGYDGFQRFVYVSNDHWLIERGVEYKLAENGKLIDTRVLSDRADREERWDIGNATQMLQEANAARDRADALLARCS